MFDFWSLIFCSRVLLVSWLSIVIKLRYILAGCRGEIICISVMVIRVLGIDIFLLKKSESVYCRILAIRSFLMVYFLVFQCFDCCRYFYNLPGYGFLATAIV